MAVLNPRDDPHRAAADAVEQGDHLWHLGHLHPASGRNTNCDPDRDPERHQPGRRATAEDVRRQQGGRPRDCHPRGGNLVAASRRSRTGQPAHPVDEQRERDDVQRVDEVRSLQKDGGCDHFASPSEASISSAFGTSLRLNIPSIRSVTKNPPTTLIVPNAIATTSRKCSSTPFASCISSSPPSTTIP